MHGMGVRMNAYMREKKKKKKLFGCFVQVKKLIGAKVKSTQVLNTPPPAKVAFI